MHQSAKHFAQKLNHCLDNVDAPHTVRERAAILSKILAIPKQQAWSLVDGHLVPDHDLLVKIAHEFEVDPKWLTGDNNKGH